MLLRLLLILLMQQLQYNILFWTAVGLMVLVPFGEFANSALPGASNYFFPQWSFPQKF